MNCPLFNKLDVDAASVDANCNKVGGKLICNFECIESSHQFSGVTKGICKGKKSSIKASKTVSCGVRAPSSFLRGCGDLITRETTSVSNADFDCNRKFCMVKCKNGFTFDNLSQSWETQKIFCRRGNPKPLNIQANCIVDEANRDSLTETARTQGWLEELTYNCRWRNSIKKQITCLTLLSYFSTIISVPIRCSRNTP